MSTGMERPIELAADKLRALLAGRRGELLLPMATKPVVEAPQRRALAGALLALGMHFDEHDDAAALIDRAFREGVLHDLRCPWGRGGDVLWCREPWTQVGRHWRYCNREVRKGDELVWLPAQRMPRAAARLVLKIDDVGITRDAAGRFVWCIQVEVQRA